MRTGRGSNPVREKKIPPRQKVKTDPAAQPTTCSMGIGVLPVTGA